MSDFKMPEAEQDHTPMKPIDFTQLGQKKVRDIHLGVKGPISVIHTRRKQINNDDAIKKEKQAHPLDKYLNPGPACEELPLATKRGRNLWEDVKDIPIEERLKMAFERGFQKRTKEVLNYTIQLDKGTGEIEYGGKKYKVKDHKELQEHLRKADPEVFNGKPWHTVG